MLFPSLSPAYLAYFSIITVKGELVCSAREATLLCCADGTVLQCRIHYNTVDLSLVVLLFNDYNTTGEGLQLLINVSVCVCVFVVYVYTVLLMLV